MSRGFGKPKQTIAALGVMAFMGVSSVIGIPATTKHEGMKLVPYYDTNHIKTWCVGETEKGYKKKFTEKECLDLFAERYGGYSFATITFYNENARKLVTPKIHAAIVDMSYNVGIFGIRKSSIIREINAGNLYDGCQAIMNFKYSGFLTPKEQSNPKIRKDPVYPLRRNCTYREHNCYGVWIRRQEMRDLCLSGI